MPIVYVSHAVAEVTRLASTLVLISDGRVRAVGPVQEVIGRAELYPMTGRFEAGAVLSVRVAAHDEGWGLTELVGAFGKLTVPRLALPVGASLRVKIRARDVILAESPPSGISALNILAGRVEAVVPIEEAALEVQLRLGDGAVAGAGDPALGGNARPRTRTRSLRRDQDRRDRSPQSRSAGEAADLDEEVEVFDG